MFPGWEYSPEKNTDSFPPPACLPVHLPRSLRCRFLSVYFFISVIALFITDFLFFLLGPCETFLICSPKPLHAICEILVNSVAFLWMLFQGRKLPILSSWIWSCRFWPCSFILTYLSVVPSWCTSFCLAVCLSWGVQCCSLWPVACSWACMLRWGPVRRFELHVLLWSHVDSTPKQRAYWASNKTKNRVL